MCALCRPSSKRHRCSWYFFYPPESRQWFNNQFLQNIVIRLGNDFFTIDFCTVYDIVVYDFSVAVETLFNKVNK